jgi:predicted acyltransferase
MILVNNTTGRTHPQLVHARWNGWTLTDLIFPFFLFIVGVALVYSLSKQTETGKQRREIYVKMARRAIVLIVLGLLINLPGYDLSNFRIPGVLQRIAVCYVIVSLLVLHTSIKWQAYIAFGLLIVYWLLIELVPVPGYGAGVLAPVGNLPGYVDGIILKGHTWLPNGFDPQGILSTLTSISNVLFGALAAHWLMSKKNELEKLNGLLAAGSIAVALSLVMGIWIVFNKRLGTPSFTLFVGGMALLFLGICYWLIDMKGYKKWTTPFLVFGKNAIAVYFLSTIIANIMEAVRIPQLTGPAVPLPRYLSHMILAPWAGTVGANLLYAVIYVLIWYGLMNILYKKKIFVKV